MFWCGYQTMSQIARFLISDGGIPIIEQIGALLDATGDDYAVAFSAVFVLQALGLSQILRLRRQAARRERERLVASRVETVHAPA